MYGCTQNLRHQRVFILLYCIGFLFVGCSEALPEKDIKENPSIVSEPQKIETIVDFAHLFPQTSFPFDLAHVEHSFDTSTYLLLPDSLCRKFLPDEPWLSPNSDDIPSIYAVAHLEATDTSSFLIFAVCGQSEKWEYTYMPLLHVGNSGTLLGRFILGEQASNAAHNGFEPITILQTGGLVDQKNGYLMITTTEHDTNFTEKHTFAIDSLGEIDGEYTIKD